MPLTTKELIAKIAATGNLLRLSKREVIRRTFELGKLVAELRTRLPKGPWLRVLKDHNYDPRSASRLLIVGRCTWNDPTQEASFLAQHLDQLTPDLNKLEHLCRLDQSNIEEMLKDHPDLAKVSRDEMAAIVKRRLGETTAKSTPKPSVEAVRKRLDGYVDRMAEVFYEFDHDQLTIEEKENLVDELLAKLVEVKTSILAVEETDSEQAGAEGEEGLAEAAPPAAEDQEGPGQDADAEVVATGE